jgi:hypothetical protein
MNQVYPHQREVYASLRDTAETFLAGAWRCLPIRPRFSRLIVGPSGVGKTHLLRVLAKNLGVPLYSINASNWLPMGCTDRGSRPTWLDIARFIHSQESGIIFLDELDKLSYPTPWMTYIRVECFSLLDREVPQQLKISLDGDEDDDPPDYLKRLEEVSLALQQRFLVVGGGAFQALWQAPKPALGFGALPASLPKTLHHSQVAGVIPTELANRFASPILCLSPMQVQDYQGMLKVALAQMPPDLRRQITLKSRKSLHAAVAHGLGCRWIEQLVLEASISSHQRMVRRTKRQLKQKSRPLNNPNPELSQHE